MKFTTFDFIRSQLGETVPPVTKADLKGKTVVVTGANIGIGFETAKHFARMSPGKLIIACRSKSRGEEALKKLRDDTGCNTVELRILDLASFASVQSFVKTFEDENDRIDVLVENAAVIAKTTPEFTNDGWESSIQVNDLSTALLALLLLPRMIDTGHKFNTTPRLVIVSSEVHYWTKFADKDVYSENFFRQIAHKDNANLIGPFSDVRYFDTKLLNIFFTRALNDKLRKSPVIVNTVNPGYCVSGLRRDAKGIQAFVYWLMEIILGRTSEEGARQLVWAALGGGNNPEELRGAYITSMKVSEPSDYIVDQAGKAVQDKLWGDLVKELSQVDSRIYDIVENILL